MQGKKQKNQSPFSKLKSFYLSCRGHLPCSCSSSSSKKYLPIHPIPLTSKKPNLADSQHEINKLSLNSWSKSNSILGYNRIDQAPQVHWQRVSELEKELIDLKQWLHTELERLRSHLRNDDERTSTTSSSTKYDGQLVKVDGGGGYLYSLFDSYGDKMLIVGVTCQNLVIQFSNPALVEPEDGSSISEILNRMATMGRENLITWLQESIHMTDISTDKPQVEIITQIKTPRSFEEAILLNAIPKLGELVIEGLQIQMGVKKVVKRSQESRREKLESRINDHNHDHEGNYGYESYDNDGVFIMAVFIQPRDAHNGYQPVNEMMVGFVEAAYEEEENEDGVLVKAVHVAGLTARRRNGQLIHNCLWCLSLPS